MRWSNQIAIRWTGFLSPTWNEKTRTIDYSLYCGLTDPDWSWVPESRLVRRQWGNRLCSYSLNIVPCTLPPWTANSPSATYTLIQYAKECEEEKENHKFKSKRGVEPGGNDFHECKHQRTVRSYFGNNESYLMKMIQIEFPIYSTSPLILLSHPSNLLASRVPRKEFRGRLQIRTRDGIVGIVSSTPPVDIISTIESSTVGITSIDASVPLIEKTFTDAITAYFVQWIPFTSPYDFLIKMRPPSYSYLKTLTSMKAQLEWTKVPQQTSYLTKLPTGQYGSWDQVTQPRSFWFTLTHLLIWLEHHPWPFTGKELVGKKIFLFSWVLRGH